MKFSNKMVAALNSTGSYSTNKYRYRLGWNMYGQEIVERMAIGTGIWMSVGLYMQRPKEY